jgi:hypothetical protein
VRQGKQFNAEDKQEAEYFESDPKKASLAEEYAFSGWFKWAEGAP